VLSTGRLAVGRCIPTVGRADNSQLEKRLMMIQQKKSRLGYLHFSQGGELAKKM
jgi:hypothetical protein